MIPALISLLLLLASPVHAESTCEVVLKLVSGRAKQTELWASKAPNGDVRSALRDSFIATTKMKRSGLPKDSEGMRELETEAEKLANKLEYLCAFWFFQKNRVEEGEALKAHLR